MQNKKLEASGKALKILSIDNQAGALEDFLTYLEHDTALDGEYQFQIVRVHDAGAGLKLLIEHKNFNLAMVEQNLEGEMKGDDLVVRIREVDKNIFMFLFTDVEPEQRNPGIKKCPVFIFGHSHNVGLLLAEAKDRARLSRQWES